MSPVSISPNFRISDGNLKIILYFVFGMIAYFVLTGKARNDRAKRQYALAGTDLNTNFAIGIRQACNPSGIGLMINVDLTFINDLMLIADQISNLDKVAEAYYSLYNEIMYERLEKELDTKKYQEWIRRARALPTTAPIPGSVAASDLYAVRDTKIFSDTDSTKIVKTVKAGETIGKWLKSYKITVKGKAQIYHLVTWTSWVFLTNQGLVLASDTKEGA